MFKCSLQYLYRKREPSRTRELSGRNDTIFLLSTKMFACFEKHKILFSVSLRGAFQEIRETHVCFVNETEICEFTVYQIFERI